MSLDILDDDLEPLARWSASALAELMTCPERFRLKYVQRVDREPSSPAQARGSAFHRARRIGNEVTLWTGLQMPLAELDDVYEQKWAEIDIDGDDAKVAEEYEKGRRMIRAYHRDLAHTFRPVEVESFFKGYVEGVPVPIVGYIDLIDDVPEIVDTKTSASRVSSVTPEMYVQALVYIAARRLPFVHHIVVATKTDAYAYALGQVSMSPKRVAAGTRLLQQAAHAVEDFDLRYGRDNHWPTWGLTHPWACTTCPFKRDGSCPAW